MALLINSLHLRMNLLVAANIALRLLERRHVLYNRLQLLEVVFLSLQATESQ